MNGNPIRILFLIIALFPGSLVRSQEISGTVYDAKTRGPLPGAIATIRQEGKTIEYQSCDTEGKFAFKQFRQGSVLEVRHLGYHPFSAPCTPGSHSILLEENSETINTAVVKAEKLTVRGDTLSYNVTALQSPADKSLQDLLKRIPGIQVSEQGYVQIRRETHQQVLHRRQRRVGFQVQHRCPEPVPGCRDNFAGVRTASTGESTGGARKER